MSEVEKYFTTRLIGAPEVATTLLSFQIAGGTRRVVFLDTNLPGTHGAYKTSGGRKHRRVLGLIP